MWPSADACCDGWAQAPGTVPPPGLRFGTGPVDKAEGTGL